MYKEALNTLLSELQLRKRRTDFHNYLVTSLYLHTCIVAIFLLILMGIDISGLASPPVPHWQFVVLMYASAIVISRIVTRLRVFLSKGNTVDLARQLDQTIQLEDRLLTAGELLQADMQHPMAELLFRDAYQQAQNKLQVETQLFCRTSWLQPWLYIILLGTMAWLFPTAFKRALRPLWDRTAPHIVQTIPTSGASKIRADQTIDVLIKFSEEMLPSAFNLKHVFVQAADADKPLPALLELSSDHRFVVLRLQEPLQKDHLYGIFVSWKLRDMAGHYLHAFPNGGSDEYWISTFRTETTTQVKTPFTITAVSPANRATDVPVNSPVLLEFTEPISAASADLKFLRLREQGAQQYVDCLVTRKQDDLVACVQPFERLHTDTQYNVFIEPGIQSKWESRPLQMPDKKVGGFLAWTAMKNKPYRFSFHTANKDPHSLSAGQDGEQGDHEEQSSGDESQPDPGNPTPVTADAESSQSIEPIVQPRMALGAGSDETTPSGLDTSSLPGPDTDDDMYTDPTDPDFQTKNETVNPLVDESELFHKRLQRIRYEEGLRGTGEQSTAGDDSPDPWMEYSKYFQQYEAVHLENLQQSLVPPVYRELVKEYFRRLQPGK